MHRKTKVYNMANSKLRITELCRQTGITKGQLAERLGLRSAASFSQALKRNNFDMDYLERIANVLGVRVVDLFQEEVDGKENTITCPKCGNTIPLEVRVRK